MIAAKAPVCILAAGQGTRMGPLGRIVNKGLLPFQGQALVSHVINQFPPGTEFVVGIGYLGQQVRDYLASAHPGLSVTFVEVDPFEGPGSGPGRSLLCCRPYLPGSFYFVPCDGTFTVNWGDVPEGNWVGTARVPADQSANYCNFAMDEEQRVVLIRDKEACDDSYRVFTGLLFVADHEVFWSSLIGSAAVKGELQISGGMRGLIEQTSVKSCPIEWTDLGDQQLYEDAIRRSTRYDFSKTSEFLYFVGDRVVKFFQDPNVVACRHAKAQLKPQAFPAIDQVHGQFYSYLSRPGRTMYEYNNPVLFARLLRWLDTEVWTAANVSTSSMRKHCQTFYRDKSLARLAAYHRKYPDQPAPRSLNGEPLDSLERVLANLDWEHICDGVPVFMHGDLQFDNILFDSDADRFVLLDWRQDFAGELSYGDLYYDLAKLLGGITINYDYIKAGLMSVESAGGDVMIDFARRFTGDAYERQLMGYVTGRGLDFGKVQTLTGLIFLNMAPLHHPPFDVALYCLGIDWLARFGRGRSIGRETTPDPTVLTLSHGA